MSQSGSISISGSISGASLLPDSGGVVTGTQTVDR